MAVHRDGWLLKLGGAAGVFNSLFSGVFVGSIVFSGAAIVHILASASSSPVMRTLAAPLQVLAAGVLAFPVLHFAGLIRLGPSTTGRRPTADGIALAVGLLLWSVMPAVVGLFGQAWIAYTAGLAAALAVEVLWERRLARRPSARRTMLAWVLVVISLYGGLTVASLVIRGLWD